MSVTSKTKRQDGWWYPWVFVAAFGVIIMVNGIMAYIAVGSWTGLETQKSFQQGQNYNAQLAQKSAQAALGWTAQVRFDSAATPDNARAGALHLTFSDRDGHGVDGLTIETLAVRPTHEGFDRILHFVASGQGGYGAPANLPLAGLWELRVTATRADTVFKMRPRIQVP